MQVKSIAECSKESILQYFRPSLSYHLSLRSLFCLFLSGRLRQVLLYVKSSVTIIEQGHWPPCLVLSSLKSDHMGSKLALGFVFPFIIVNMTWVAVECKLNMSNPLLGTLFLLMGLNFPSLYGLMSHFTYLPIVTHCLLLINGPRSGQTRYQYLSLPLWWYFEKIILFRIKKNMWNDPACKEFKS